MPKLHVNQLLAKHSTIGVEWDAKTLHSLKLTPKIKTTSRELDMALYLYSQFFAFENSWTGDDFGVVRTFTEVSPKDAGTREYVSQMKELHSSIQSGRVEEVDKPETGYYKKRIYYEPSDKRFLIIDGPYTVSDGCSFPLTSGCGPAGVQIALDFLDNSNNSMVEHQHRLRMRGRIEDEENIEIGECGSRLPSRMALEKLIEASRFVISYDKMGWPGTVPFHNQHDFKQIVKYGRSEFLSIDRDRDKVRLKNGPEEDFILVVAFVRYGPPSY